MAHPTYDPYYLHHQSRHQPPLEYYHPHHPSTPETTAHSYVYNEAHIPIHIPKEQRHINTLFVSGLPDDVIPREIHNLFRRHPGFDSCQLKFTGRGNQVVAFVTFFNHQSAVSALQTLDGVKFDPQTESVLHIELARSNSRRKHKSGRGPYVVIDMRKAADDDREVSSDDGDNKSDDQSQSGDSDSASHDAHPTNEKSAEKKTSLNDPEVAVNKQKEKALNGDLQPCSTLFIANLGPNCSEEELRQALSQYPGFNGLKLCARGGMPVAFADYEEVEQATNAMQALEGSTLPSSDRGSMLIEYARSKMRKP